MGSPISSALEIPAGVTSPFTLPPKVAEDTKGRCFLPGRRPAPFSSFVCWAAGAKGSGYQRPGRGRSRLVNGPPGTQAEKDDEGPGPETTRQLTLCATCRRVRSRLG